MIIITLVFVILYIGALLGWLKPFSDITMVARLEPIIFTIIGFYFGRMPARENERNLREEIERQAKKSEADQLNREQIQQEREILEEKIKNVQTILYFAEKNCVSSLRENNLSAARSEISTETLRHSLKTAMNVLNS